MFPTLQNPIILLLGLGLFACSSGGGSTKGGGKDKPPLVSGAQTGSTPFAPRDQEEATISFVPDQDATLAVWKSRVTMLAGTTDVSATLSLRLVPDGVIQTSSLMMVSPIVNFNAITSSGPLLRSAMKKPLKVETIVDRYVNAEETAVIFIEHYGQPDEKRHMILPTDLSVAIQEDQSRLVTFETRDTDFAFAVAAAKGGALQPGFVRYVTAPPENKGLTFSAIDVTDEATEAYLSWTPGEGTRAGYRLEISESEITTTGCENGEDLVPESIIIFRQNFPKVFTDSYIATGLTENATIHFQLCSLNDRDPPDASNGINGRYELPKRALAVLSGTPNAVTGATALSVTVGGVGIQQYQYALRTGTAAASCDGATFSDWTSITTPVTATGLTEGAHRLCVLGKKSDKNVQRVATEFAWSVDLTPPGAFTISAVTTPTNDVTPTFSWTASAEASTYQVKVATDAACATVVQTFTSSATSATATTLADGTYYVCVRAVDASGNGVDASNNGQSFVLDAVPPAFTSLNLINSVADGYLNATEFAGSVDLVSLSATGYTTAAYKLVTAATSCNGTLTYGDLPKSDSSDFGADGSYKVCVKLQDAATNTTYGASPTFDKDVSIPSFTSLALANDAADGFVSAAETDNATPLAGSLAATGYTVAAYALTSAATTCDDGLTYGAVPTSNSSDFGSDGSYKICVELSDPAGNPSVYGATASFVLDTTGPSTFTITAPSDASTVHDNTPTVSWTDPGDATAFDVKVDDASGCPSPYASHLGVVGLTQTLSTLPNGVWYVCVDALDDLGNVTSAPEVSFAVAAGGWISMTSAGAPLARHGATMVWDSVNSRAIVWGGHSDSDGVLASGGAYDPSNDTWSSTDESDGELPEARQYHAAVWTGTQMIVWGGLDGLVAPLQTGGIYTPDGPDSWTAVTTSGAPVARYDHAAFWTGSAMLVYGGTDGTVNLNSGGLYDPVLDIWTATDELDADLPSARSGEVRVWTGSKLIIWGGNDGACTNTGAIFDPAGPDYWTTMSTVGAPSARCNAHAVWTGTHMIVWGGANGGFLSDGAIYDPSSDTWAPMISTNAPVGRTHASVVWDDAGSRMIVWGGTDGSYLATGAVYDAANDEWIVPDVPLHAQASARAEATSVWTGTEMVVFGGTDGTQKGTAGSYVPP